MPRNKAGKRGHLPLGKFKEDSGSESTFIAAHEATQASNGDPLPANHVVQQVVISQCKPDNFEDGDLRRYVEHFVAHAKANGWNDRTKCLRLPLFLRGRALLIFQQLELKEECSWESLIQIFVAAFHPTEERLVWLRRFYDRKWLPGEPMEAMVKDLKRMLSLAVPNVSLLELDAILTCQLLAALPKELSNKLEVQAQLLTFDQVAARVRLLQLQPRTTAGNDVCHVQHADPMNQILDRLDVMQSEINAISTQRNKDDPTHLSRCFNCGGLGHWARDCRCKPAVRPVNTSSGKGRGTWRRK